jgi:hypothetical protein
MQQSISIGISDVQIVEHISKYTTSLYPFGNNFLSHWKLTGDQPYWGYLCPICLVHGFWTTDGKLLFGTGIEFSEDHYPPASVGGFENLVVCKTCNNAAGGKYEAELQKLLAQNAFANKIPGSSLITQYQVSNVDGRYWATLGYRNNGQPEVSFKPNAKAHTPLVDRWLERSKTDHNWSAQLMFKDADQQKINMALLKAAYLYCFSAWGYEFAFSYTAGKIRRIIFGVEKSSIDIPSFWLGGKTAPGTQLPVGVCYFFKNPLLKCFAVNIPLTESKTKYSDLACVLIPGPSESNWNDIMAATGMLEQYGPLTFNVERVLEHFVGPDEISGYSKCWELLQRKE